MKAGIIFNPSSGRGRGVAIATAVQASLTKRGLDAELHATSGPRDATGIAERIACDVDYVVAIGGDGTINEVVNGMVTAGTECRKAKLGIVPAGTVNVLAGELGLPFQVERACKAIAEGKTISLDVGMVNDRGFILMTGAGIDALTVRNIDPRQKKRFKELAFVGTGLRWGLASDPPAFVVRSEGQEFTATYFVASNCRYIAGHVGLTPDADPTDGLLDLLIFTGTTRSSLAVFWLGVPSGLHLRSPNVIHLRTKRAELIPLQDGETVYFQTDGELAGKLPATVKIDAHALEVVVP